MTLIDLAAIEKATKERQAVVWRYRSSYDGNWQYWPGESWAENTRREHHPEAEPLFPDQSATILALCARVRELEAALKPFATCIDRLAPGLDIAHWRLTDTLNHNLTVADVILARNALITETDNG